MPYQATIGKLQVTEGGCPPVYDPGGPTWIAAGAGTAEDFETAEAAARAAGVVQIVVPFGEADVVLPLGFEAMSDFWQGKGDGTGAAPVATPADLERMLDLAAARRADYAQVQPVFWREAEDARALQQRWFEEILTLKDHQAFALPDGFLMAALRGEAWLVDDFAVAEPDAWETVGKRLLTSLDGPVLVICGCHDVPKQLLLRELGFTPGGTWFQRTLAT